ncbi:MAG TPA: FAD-dependent oxidoreductase [Nocardioides sp.]|uniref:NAD(P)/FAD-dependent oxidoreductase n=1 Tax=Nocardioides sp. TaxID=35761 RepID=UPI002B65D86A|nr:FAD-dependent oxidoreductase [Nocardioides sp.]HQR25715.1 FAD-dependent oxidoreductase [Nocardioides sp.]
MTADPAAAHPSLADAAPEVLWLDDPDRPAALDPLPVGPTRAELVVVGGGYTGLWTALRAKERRPETDVLLLEAGECGWQASGRNGGFAAASLTHGFHNGVERWPDELAELDRLGAENLAEIGRTVSRYDIDCRFERTGGLDVATEPHQVHELAETAAAMLAAGHDVVLLDRAAVRAEVDSPTYLAGLLDPHGVALVEPARLAWGLRRACLDLGVRIHEQTLVTGLLDDGRTLEVDTDRGAVRADRVVLATNAFPPLLRRLRLMTVPVYDHVLATEPLTPAQLAALGWEGRQGIGDSANLFHYYRLTRDHRIVWGGYDAVYHYGSRIAPPLEQNRRTHALLARHFFETFPQLEGLRFTHRWGGVIDTCTRFAAFFGTAFDGRVAYAMGYTGLGVAATRFGADVVLDLLDGAETERTRLRMVRERPLPFPPEPVRALGITLTRWSLERADRNAGRRNLWLRTLDGLGLGFDS